jgi:colanic acid biosynthesis glycosyl transferase WcaI
LAKPLSLTLHLVLLRILLINQLFQPEPNLIKGLRFAQELNRCGNAVQVLTGFPNYPGGKIYPGYRMKPVMRENLDGVEIIRVAHFPSHDRSGFRRFLNYSSFALGALLLGPTLVKQPDVIHVYQGPATLMIPAYLIARRYGSRIILDIQDIWPESVTESGMLPLPFGKSLLTAYCRWTYRIADGFIALSDGVKETLIKRGVSSEKIKKIYNWCDESAMLNGGESDNSDLDQFFSKDKFNLLYAGSLGRMQDLDSVLDAMLYSKTNYPKVQLLLVGDGIEARRLEDRAKEMGLTNTLFVPRQTPGDAARFLSRADALLIHLRDDSLAKGAIPQKTQAYLAAGRPIIIGVNGEAADLVLRARGGIKCVPCNPKSIFNAIKQLADMSPHERMVMGNSGRDFYRRELSFDCGCRSIKSFFHNTIAGLNPSWPSKTLQ